MHAGQRVQPHLILGFYISAHKTVYNMVFIFWKDLNSCVFKKPNIKQKHKMEKLLAEKVAAMFFN